MPLFAWLVNIFPVILWNCGICFVSLPCNSMTRQYYYFTLLQWTTLKYHARSYTKTVTHWIACHTLTFRSETLLCNMSSEFFCEFLGYFVGWGYFLPTMSEGKRFFSFSFLFFFISFVCFFVCNVVYKKVNTYPIIAIKTSTNR